MTQMNDLIAQAQEWIAGDRIWDDMDANLQSVIDDLIAEESDEGELVDAEDELLEEVLTKSDPDSSDVHVDGVNWKTSSKKKKKPAAADAMDLIQKANEEQKFTLGPWYIPNREDAHGEWSDADELQKALWDYVRLGNRDIRLQHNTDIVAGEWVEAMSFPVPVTLNMKKAGGDSKEVTYPTGTVFLGVKWNDWAWEMVKENKITGFSIGGSAARVEMGIPADEMESLTKNRFTTAAVAAEYANDIKTSRNQDPISKQSPDEDSLKTAIRNLINGVTPEAEVVQEPVQVEPEVKKSIIIGNVRYAIVPLSKSFGDKVFNVAGLYGEDGSVSVVRTDGERFWASGAKYLENLPFHVAQYAFAEVAKAKQSFGGNRSAAGQYAADVRWGRVAGEQKTVSEMAGRGIAATGTGGMPAATTEGGMVQETRFASLQTHCDFDAMAADMKAQGLNPSVDEPDYSTLRKHITPERAALHDKIIDSHFQNEDGTPKTPPAGQPEYVFMGGGPASGKSSMLAEGAGPEWAGNGTNRSDSRGGRGTDRHSVAINADEIKGDLPPYGALVGGAGSKGGVGVARRVGQMTAASTVHEESSILGKAVNARAVQGGFNVILDGTGDNSAKSMTGKIDQIRNARGPEGAALNYRVTGIYATVPTAMAVQRARDRGRPVGQKYYKDGDKPDNPTGSGQGRYVNDSIVVGTHRGVSTVFPVVAGQFDSVKLLDTSGNPPRLILSGTKGKGIVVNDEKAYADFVAKG
jgi:hypothetical protein